MKNPYKDTIIEISNGFWNHELMAEFGVEPYDFDDELFEACIKIFSSAMLKKHWDKNINNPDKIHPESLGQHLRNFIIDYTGLDTVDLIKE